ncbi:ornithine carbamoyltransferase [Streptomyces atriruber]|uniref:ornithine carbamoyltransferase n=1 Tax=Streptomyces atriruber TaxID=545121 RepID=UPI0006E1A341|nr:ornithine carbamoyltransferase [Streptomyces atriruber]
MTARHILRIQDLSAKEMCSLLDLAEAMKRGDDSRAHLAGRCIGLLFNVPSTRTRVSFQVAASQLGADSYPYGVEELRLANRESIEDTIGVLNRYLDALVVRWYDMNEYGAGHRRLRAMAEQATIPVINALDDEEHPCQVLADLMTLRELFGAQVPAKRIVYAWSYSPRQKTPGVLHSSMMAAALLGHRITVAHPPGFAPEERVTRAAREVAAGTGASVELTHDLAAAVRGSAAVYTLSWKSPTLVGQEEIQSRTRLADHWRITAPLMQLAADDAVFLDCMPTNRGEEVDAEVKDGPRSRIFQQAENRLHTQKALLTQLFDGTLTGDRR